jgi:Zn-dependent protease with chaperone function
MVPLHAATIVLQSRPTLDTVVVLWVVLCVVGVVIGAVGSAFVRRLSNPVAKYRALYLGVVFPYGLGAYGLLALFDFGAAVRAVFIPEIGGIVAAFLAEFATTLAAGVAVLAAYGPTVRGVRAVRDIELTTTAALAQMTRYIFVFCVIISPVFVVLYHSGGMGGWFVVLAGFAVLLFVTSPWVIVALRSTCTLTDAETDRLARLRDRAGLAVNDARVLETGDADTAGAQVRGPPGYRRLFVTDAFLDRFDDETVAALLAVQAGRIRTHVLARQAGTILGAGGIAMIALGMGGLFTALIAGVGVLLVGFWFTRRGVLRADEYAAERAGTDALVSAFERYAAIHEMEPSRRRLPNPLSANVALGDRIDRLRGAQPASTD